MKTNRTQIGVALLAALALAGGGTAVAQANDGYGDGGHHKGGHKIVVKGDNNQLVLGNHNKVDGRGDISGDPGAGEGDEATAPREPYGTVHRNVAYLSERSAPRTTATEVARFGPDTQVPLSCWVPGENVHGNTTWYRVRDENEFRTGYVSAYYVTLKGAISRCS
ncbi:hypothetical protein DB35_07270 [Streptomyces abyssalis]|uniref:Ig-like domain-containing protein n=1 Tax=Streptomyces abyssalis TaxID=933944 RepID=A0A1E7JSP9_9ACTN|nr:hypothetical protein [Streptomyces abyssalis]OEU91922.1 hypothetical protein AN215_05510 [Streptomyces abyssalis]OEU93935.1 hypothetical protein DB35_07270 [Streptomyces abyssalis]OEV30646.1 hypothetical protein AN219_09705 [Streptomyces nanshensis]